MIKLIQDIPNCLRAALLALMVSGALVPLHVQISSATETLKDKEAAIKSAFIYNFTKFIQWPQVAGDESVQENLDLYILGSSALTEHLMKIDGRKAGDRKISVTRLENVEMLKKGVILVICETEAYRLKKILNKVRGRNILTISDIEGFAPAGGMIGLYKERNKIRFEINTDAARRAGIVLSSHLLKLARIVQGAEAYGQAE